MTDLRLRIGFQEDTTPEEAEEHTRDLLELVERVDADRVDLVRAPGAVPPGVRAGDPAAVAGAILLAGVAVRQAVPHIAAIVQEWLRTRAQKSVTVEADGAKVTLEGHHVRPEQVEAFLSALLAERSGEEGGSRSSGGGRGAEDRAEGDGAGEER
nr:hypothetical protein [Nocardiopsis potens]